MTIVSSLIEFAFIHFYFQLQSNFSLIKKTFNSGNCRKDKRNNIMLILKLEIKKEIFFSLENAMRYFLTDHPVQLDNDDY